MTKFSDYMSNGHMMLSVHRQLYKYDPSIVGTGAFSDILLEEWNESESSSTLYELIDEDYFGNNDFGKLPVSYINVLTTMQLNWINLILRVVIGDNMIEEFAAEYADTVISINKTVPSDEDFFVFRSMSSGSSIFETACIIHLSNVLSESLGDALASKKTLLKAYINIIRAYEQLGTCINGDKDLVLGAVNLNGKNIREVSRDQLKYLLKLVGQ